MSSLFTRMANPTEKVPKKGAARGPSMKLLSNVNLSILLIIFSIFAFIWVMTAHGWAWYGAAIFLGIFVLGWLCRFFQKEKLIIGTGKSKSPEKSW